MKKFLIVLISIIGAIVLLTGVVHIVGPKVDSGGYRYVIGGFLDSYIVPTNKQVKSVKEKAGGIIHGVCHPKNWETVGTDPETGAAIYQVNSQTVSDLKDCHYEWVRFDLTSPSHDAEGNLTAGYLNFKAQAKAYADAGFKVMCVTPYPSEYLYYSEFGGNEDTNTYSTIDPRTEAGLAYVAEDAKFICQDLQGIVAAFQITNEMPVDRFRKPLTLEEAAEYIRVQLKAMNDYKGDILVGYNVADFTMYNLYQLLEDCNCYCDYLGVDLYLGCFESTFKDLFIYDFVLRGFFGQSHLPIIVNEFGYIGSGTAMSRDDKNQFLLDNFGYNNEDEAKADIQNLLLNTNFKYDIKVRLMSEVLADDYLGDPTVDDQIATLNDNQKTAIGNLLFGTGDTNGYSQHFYECLNEGFQLTNYEHTEEDQARFYTDLINDHFAKMPFLIGCFAYCWSNPSECYICGSAKCPVETGWGMLDSEGNRKACFDAIKDAFENWK